MKDLTDVEMKEMKEATKAAIASFKNSIQGVLRAHMTALRLQGYDESVAYDMARDYTASDLNAVCPHWLKPIERYKGYAV